MARTLLTGSKDSLSGITMARVMHRTEATIETSRDMLCTKVTVRFKADYTAIKILEMICFEHIVFHFGKIHIQIYTIAENSFI